jgi:hypothetical protein
MATEQTATNASQANASPEVRRALKKKARRAGKKKLVAKIRTDKEFAKTYFEGRSKRSTDKKSTFRKKKSRKK